MTDSYTIVKPHVEFFEPPDETDYLEFLERCTRVCYKSEEHIKLGSAEKLLSKVVKEFEHYSVLEHVNCIMEVSTMEPELTWNLLTTRNPLLRIGYQDRHKVIVSGNMRMWLDLFKNAKGYNEWYDSFKQEFNKKFPFFAVKMTASVGPYHPVVRLIDENPITNKDNLSLDEMKKHMTATFKFVGDRSMSHQLVRHRLFAFSQESQRYCNYGKKGLQVILPPSIKMLRRGAPLYTMGNENNNAVRNCDPYYRWCASVKEGYADYLALIEAKVPPEDARSLLPNCTKTEVVTTGTLGYWIDHIFPHRGHNPKAQWQIREYCLEAEEILKEKVPGVFNES